MGEQTQKEEDMVQLSWERVKSDSFWDCMGELIHRQ